MLPPDQSFLATGYNNVGLAWGELGDYHRELEYLQKAFAIQEKALPFGDSNRIMTFRYIAQVYGKLGNSVKQAEYNERADLEHFLR